MLNVTNLIGFGVGATGVEPLSFTYVGSAYNTAGTSTDIDVSGLSPAAGDFYIATMSGRATGGLNSGNATKTGWVRHNFGAVSANQAMMLFTRIADSGDLGTVSVQLTGVTLNGSAMLFAIHVYRPNRAITETPTAFDATYEGPIAGNITPVVKNADSYAAPNFVIAHYASSGTVNPRTMTGATNDFNASHPLGSTDGFAGLVQNTSPVDITVDMADEGSNNRMLSTGLYFV